jgi:hypothetical protein
MIDATYKTNKFKMPLLHITGVTCLQTTFDICYTFEPAEDQEHHLIALQPFYDLRREYGIKPKVFLTDKEDGLKKALTRLFLMYPSGFACFTYKPTFKRRQLSAGIDGVVIQMRKRRRSRNDAMTSSPGSMSFNGRRLSSNSLITGLPLKQTTWKRRNFLRTSRRSGSPAKSNGQRPGADSSLLRS